MEPQEILDKVIKIVREKLDLGSDKEVDEDTTFASDLGTDSLDQAELIMEFEEAFGIEISDDIAKGAIAIKDAVKIIQDLLAKQGR
jgi:acyl carrier protein